VSEDRRRILVCTGGASISSGTGSLTDAFRRELAECGLTSRVEVIITGNLRAPGARPIALIHPDGVFYQRVRAPDVTEIVREHLLHGKIVDRLFHRRVGEGELDEVVAEFDYYRFQKRIALRNWGNIDPESIEDYIAAGGYEALCKALTEMSPKQVIEEIKDSGLRGRGGAGFPTGLKWEITSREKGTTKYVVCNADEGDPGAFMDRSILEGDPHSVIEAMAICGYAIGAGQGYIYVRAEYPLAIRRLGIALHQARERGMLGARLFGSSFAFDVEIRIGAGAFVCGEETALMRSVEGKRGEPRPRPPFPAQKGLFERPTVLNNVETFANVPYIVLNGGEGYSSVGSGKSKGTKVFALAGHVNNTGLVEVPMGITLGSIVYDIGGGISDGKKFKAAQLGGPSGGCVPKGHLNVPITYESLPALGAIMGSGGLIVMNEETCMVDLARYFLDFMHEESCGKCTPCRIGSRILLNLVTGICEGRGTMEDLDRLESLSLHMRATALCGLGQTAPNPALSTLRYFREEYVEHIREGHCRAGVCRSLMHAPCSNSCPAMVNVPAYLAYTNQGKFDEAIRVHLRNNPFPSICGRVCPQWCIKKCRRNDLEGPLAVRAVKRFIGDYREEYGDLFPDKAEPNGKKVAVIGAGPAGLTCGYYLTLLGYQVTVFEKQPEPGGMLRYAIPDYRLPREVTAKEIRSLEQLGLEIRTNVAVGEEVTLAGLGEEGYEAFFLATGAGKEIVPGNVPGFDLPGVIPGIRFLEQVAKNEPVQVGRTVLVIGGGDVAIDCSRVVKRCGAEEVTVVYRRTREEMPTSPIEIAEAELEGIQVELLCSPVKVEPTEDGRLQVTIRRMGLGSFDESGRRRPEPIEGSDFTRTVDTILLAVGQKVDVEGVILGTDLEPLGNRMVADLKTGATDDDTVFAGGDLVTGSATVIEAIAAGQRAARTIDQKFFPGERTYFWEELPPPEVDVDPEREIGEEPPVTFPMLSPDERMVGVEVEKTITNEDAMRESGRCLRCDYRGEGHGTRRRMTGERPQSRSRS
jgi:NADH-quinone oxidoreductase subunit F